MIKSEDLEYIKNKILGALEHLKSTIEDYDVTEVKADLLETLDHMKTGFKNISIKAMLKEVEWDDMLDMLDFQEFFKGLRGLLKEWALDRVLKDLDMDGIVNDASLIVNSFTELVENLDLNSFVEECMNIVTKALDFDSLQLFWNNYVEGWNVDNMFEGFKKMWIGMDFETIRNGELNVIKALESLIRGVFDLLTGLKFKFTAQDVTPQYHKEGNQDESKKYPFIGTFDKEFKDIDSKWKDWKTDAENTEHLPKKKDEDMKELIENF